MIQLPLLEAVYLIVLHKIYNEYLLKILRFSFQLVIDNSACD